MLSQLALRGTRRWRAASRAVVLVLAVAVPLVFDTNVRPVFARPKFTVLAAGAAVLGVLAVGRLAVGRSAPWSRNGIEAPVLLLLGWAAVSAAVSADPRTSLLGGPESVNGVVTLACFVIVFFAVADGFRARDARSALGVVWYAACGPVLAYGAVQLGDAIAEGSNLDPVLWLNTPPEGSIWSTLGNPADLAGFLAVMLPVGVLVIATARTALARALSTAMTGLLVVELAYTTTRGALIAAAAAITVLTVWFRRELLAPARRWIALGSVVVAVALAGLAVTASARYTNDDVSDLVDTTEGSTAALRVELWRTAWDMARDDLVFGVGPDGFTRAFDSFRTERFLRAYGPQPLATDPHNIFLNQLATLGVPGLVLFVAVLAAAGGRVATSAARVGRAGPVDRLLLAAVASAIVAHVVQASFNRHDLALEFTFWFLLGLLSALSPPASAGAAGSEQRDDPDRGGQRAHPEGDPRDRVTVVPIVVVRDVSA